MTVEEMIEKLKLSHPKQKVVIYINPPDIFYEVTGTIDTDDGDLEITYG